MYVYINPHYVNIDAITKFAFVSRGIDIQVAGNEGWIQLNKADPSFEPLRAILMARVIATDPAEAAPPPLKRSRFDS